MSVPQIIDQWGRPIAARPRARQMAGGFRGASYVDPDLAGWVPPNYSAYSAHSGDRIPLTARIHDLARNDGWISSGVTRKVDTVIGSVFRLNARPNWRALGIDRQVAEELSDAIEAEWKAFSEDHEFYIDAGRRLNFAGLVALNYRHRLLDGEAIAVMDWREDPGSIYSTCVQTVDPSRLCNPNMQSDIDQLRDGVQLGPRGEPIGYHIRNSHPGDSSIATLSNQQSWTYYPRSLPFGRRVVVHAFIPDRAGQVRGVSQMASLIKKIKNLGRYDDAELQAALINAVMAAVIQSPFDHAQLAESMSGGEELSAYQADRAAYYQDAPLTVGGAKVFMTYPGEEVKFTKPEHPNAVFENYIRSGLRNVAAVLGMTYEQLSGDWSQSNYSSARGALIEAWRGFYAERDTFGMQFAQPIYSCFLEEAIDRGRIKLPAGAPDFYAARGAWTAATWTGPGRGWVDPMKEAQAAALRIAAGLSTYEEECAEQGLDYREVLAQIAREREEMRELGLDPEEFRSAGVKGGAAPKPDQTNPADAPVVISD